MSDQLLISFPVYMLSLSGKTADNNWLKRTQRTQTVPWSKSSLNQQVAMVLLLGSLDLSWRTCWLWVSTLNLSFSSSSSRHGDAEGKSPRKDLWLYETCLSMDFFLPQHDSQGNSKCLTILGAFNQWWLWCWQCSITHRLSLSLSRLLGFGFICSVIRELDVGKMLAESDTQQFVWLG